MAEKPAEETAPYGGGAPSAPTPIKRIRTHHLREMKQRGEKISMLTAYDMLTAATFDEAGIEMLLVGEPQPRVSAAIAQKLTCWAVRTRAMGRVARC